MRVMADLLRRGRYADEVVGLLARSGRNDPCLCGSGRKAKLCHRRRWASVQTFGMRARAARRWQAEHRSCPNQERARPATHVLLASRRVTRPTR